MERTASSGSTSDLYEVLGVPRSASPRRIRQAVRALQRAGDDCRTDDAVRIADHVLGDPALRARYDALIDRLRDAGMPIPTIGATAGFVLPDDACSTPEHDDTESVRTELVPAPVVTRDRGWVKVVAVVCVLVTIIAVSFIVGT